MAAPKHVVSCLLAVVLGAGCGSTEIASPTTSTTVGEVGDSAPALGAFPEFPEASLPASMAASLQAVLDGAVGDGTFVGVTAAVIVGGRGTWTGAAGVWDGVPVTTESVHPTHSAAKTVVAAEVLRLVEEGRLGLEDAAADHLPATLGFFDANGAMIRQVLAMRSGIPDLNEDAGYYPAEQASTVAEAFEMLPGPSVAPDTVTHYASTNYVLLGAIIEQVTGMSLADALRSDVLDHPGLDGIRYGVEDAFAGDGWRVETTAASLARWGYDLFGGVVLSEATLLEMTDFKGQWYGLGVMDLSGEFGVQAFGHQGLSSVTTCCSAIVFVAFPDEAVVIAVQANTADTPAYVDTNSQVDRLAGALRRAAQP